MNEFEEKLYKKFGTRNLTNQEMKQILFEAVDRNLIHDSEVNISPLSTATELLREIRKKRRSQMSDIVHNKDQSCGSKEHFDSDLNSVNCRDFKQNNTEQGLVERIGNISPKGDCASPTYSRLNGKLPYGYSNIHRDMMQDKEFKTSKKIERVIEAFLKYEDLLEKRPKRLRHSFIIVIVLALISLFLYFSYTPVPY